jgi:glutamyl-tRNA synthetase
MADAAVPFLNDAISIDAEAAKKFLTQEMKPALIKLISNLDQLPRFEHAELEGAFKMVLDEAHLGMGKLAQPVRVALTGRTASPGIFEVMVLLGCSRTLERLRKAIDLIA